MTILGIGLGLGIVIAVIVLIYRNYPQSNGGTG